MLKYLPDNDQNPIIQPDLLLNTQFMLNVASECESDDTLAADNLELLKKDRNKDISLIKGLIKTFGREFLWLGLMKLVNDTLNFSGPLLLNKLVQFVELKGLYEDSFSGAQYFNLQQE